MSGSTTFGARQRRWWPWVAVAALAGEVVVWLAHAQNSWPVIVPAVVWVLLAMTLWTDIIVARRNRRRQARQDAYLAIAGGLRSYAAKRDTEQHSVVSPADRRGSAGW